MDDGSAVWDGSDSAGARVLVSGVPLPAPGDFVRVPGASSATVLGFRTVGCEGCLARRDRDHSAAGT